MAVTSKLSKKIAQTQIVIDDTLKDRPTTSPLFSEKIEIAMQIMSRVRAKEEKSAQ